MIKYFRYVFLLFLTCFSSSSKAQSLYSSEKVFIQTDKDYYFEGDTIWAKVTVFNGNNHNLSDSSKVVFVNLVNSEGLQVKQLIIKLEQSQSNFNLVIPKNQNGSEHRLVAYTNYMLNQADCFQFQKKIYVFTSQNINAKPIIVAESPHLKFYPEGGDLVSGIKSKIAFQSILKGGKGFNLKGKIIDQHNNEIINFESSHLGIGFFYLTPESNSEYYAVFEHDGSLIKTMLPKAKEAGYTLAVHDLQANAKGYLIEVNSSIKNRQALTLLIHQRGTILLNTTFADTKNTHKFLFSNSEKVKSSIVHITLFDQNNHPLAERLIFNYEKQAFFDFGISLINEQIKPFKKIEFSIELKKDNKAINLALPLSIVVLDASQENIDPNNANMSTYMFLNSDLKGIIEEPNSYFEMPLPKAKYCLDNLMLTHGWRRFIWNESPKTDFKVENSLKLSGIANKNNRPLINQTIFLNIWDDKGFQTKVVLTDSKGVYEVTGNWMGNIVILGLDQKGKEIQLVQNQKEIKIPETQFFALNTQFKFDEFVNYTRSRNSNLKETELNEVVVKGKKSDDL